MSGSESERLIDLNIVATKTCDEEIYLEHQIINAVDYIYESCNLIPAVRWSLDVTE